MIIEFLSKQNEEIIQVELIYNYLKELESNDPIILSKFKSEIFRDLYIDIKVDKRIIRIRLRENIPSNPLLSIKIFNEQDLLIEEINALISNCLIEKSRGVAINYAKLNSDGNIIEKQYIYQKDCLKRNKERIIETSLDEIQIMAYEWFKDHSIADQKVLLEEHNFSEGEVIKYLQSKISFQYIIKKIQEKRDIKIAYQNAKEKPTILFKK